MVGKPSSHRLPSACHHHHHSSLPFSGQPTPRPFAAALALNIGLTELGLGGTDASGDLGSLLWRLSHLTALHLFECDKVTGDVAVIESLPRLVKVNIKGCAKLSGDKAALAKALPGTMLKM